RRVHLSRVDLGHIAVRHHDGDDAADDAGQRAAEGTWEDGDDSQRQNGAATVRRPVTAAVVPISVVTATATGGTVFVFLVAAAGGAILIVVTAAGGAVVLILVAPARGTVLDVGAARGAFFFPWCWRRSGAAGFSREGGLAGGTLDLAAEQVFRHAQ